MNPASQTPLADLRVAAERAEANKGKGPSTPLDICKAGRRFSIRSPGCRTQEGTTSWTCVEDLIEPYLHPSLARNSRLGQLEDRRPSRRRRRLACEHVHRFMGGEGRASSSSPSPQPDFRWPGTAPTRCSEGVDFSSWRGTCRQRGDASSYTGWTGN